MIFTKVGSTAASVPWHGMTSYMLGIPFFAFRTILTNTLAANMRQKLILRNTVITVASNIALDFLLVPMPQWIVLR